MSKDDANIGLLKNYMDIGIGLLMTASFTAVKMPEIFETFTDNWIDGVLSMALFIATCAFLSGWIYFDFQEIQLVDEAFDTSRVKFNSFPFATAVLVGVGSGILVNVTNNPKIYTIVMGIIIFISMFGIPLVRKNFANVKINKGKEEIANLIITYYREHHFIFVDLVTLAIMTFGIILVSNPNSKNLNLLQQISSLIMLFVLIVHEAIFWNWRIRRNKEIDIARSEEVTEEEKKSSPKKKA
jgi:hypothetical protein